MLYEVITNQEKIDQVILHPRLSTQLYHGRANWALFQTAREIFPELVVNGDICTLKDLSNVSNYSSEIMIGVITSYSIHYTKLYEKFLALLNNIFELTFQTTSVAYQCIIFFFGQTL